MNKERLFRDLRNLLNYKTYLRLKENLVSNKKIKFFRIVNNKRYSYRVIQDSNKKWGIMIKNLTDFHSLALMVDRENFTKGYNQLINSIVTELFH